MNKYEVLGVVGEGAYGVVLKCRNKESNEICAIKKFKESDDDNDEVLLKTTQREVKILRMLRHNNIVTLIEAFKRKSKLYLVFEFVEKNLLEVLEENASGLEPDLARLYTHQLVQAIQWCHSNNVIHRDIKPENLLINQRTKILKLCDFGFARMISQPPQNLTDYVATRWYRAPELLLGSTNYTLAVDIWAIGCILGEITDGQPLFPGESEIDQLYIIQKIIGPLIPEHLELFLSNSRFSGLKFPDMSKPETLQKKYVGNMAKKAISFMKALLTMDPRNRPSATECLTHSYFDNLDGRKSGGGGIGNRKNDERTSTATTTKIPIQTSSNDFNQNVTNRHQNQNYNYNEKNSSILPVVDKLKVHPTNDLNRNVFSTNQALAKLTLENGNPSDSLMAAIYADEIENEFSKPNTREKSRVDKEKDRLKEQQQQREKEQLEREAEKEKERQREKEIRAFREFSTKLPFKQQSSQSQSYSPSKRHIIIDQLSQATIGHENILPVTTTTTIAATTTTTAKNILEKYSPTSFQAKQLGPLLEFSPPSDYLLTHQEIRRLPQQQQQQQRQQGNTYSIENNHSNNSNPNNILNQPYLIQNNGGESKPKGITNRPLGQIPIVSGYDNSNHSNMNSGNSNNILGYNFNENREVSGNTNNSNGNGNSNGLIIGNRVQISSQSSYGQSGIISSSGSNIMSNANINSNSNHILPLPQIQSSYSNSYEKPFPDSNLINSNNNNNSVTGRQDTIQRVANNILSPSLLGQISASYSAVDAVDSHPSSRQGNIIVMGRIDSKSDSRERTSRQSMGGNMKQSNHSVAITGGGMGQGGGRTANKYR